MALIYILIFSILFSPFSQIHPESIKEKKSRILNYMKDKKYSEAIFILREYIKLKPDELIFKLYLAKSILLRDDLKLPGENEDPFENESRENIIINNYKESTGIFRSTIPIFENASPGAVTTKLDQEKIMTLGEWYFYWALSEWHSGSRERAIGLFETSFKKNPNMINALYNISIIYEELDKYPESEVSFNYYKKKLKERAEKK